MPLPQQKPKSNVRRIGTIAFDETQMKNMIGVDFMGRYPTKSRDGNKYILIMYDYDTNYIRGIPVKERKAEAYLKAFKTIFDDLTAKGFKPELVRLDNEASKLLCNHIEADN